MFGLVATLLVAKAAARFTETVNPSLTHQSQLYRRSLLSVSDSTDKSVSVPCNATAVGGGNVTYGTLHCNDDYASVPYTGDYAQGFENIGNTDYFQSATQPVTNMGRTVSGPYSAAARDSSYSLYNVHATLAETAAPVGAIVSWAAGLPAIGTLPAVLATLPGGDWTLAKVQAAAGATGALGDKGAFPAPSAPAGTVFLSNVSHGSASSTTQYELSFPAVAIQYLRNFLRETDVKDPSGTVNWGTPADFVYLSAPQYHAQVHGLAYNTRYYYVVESVGLPCCQSLSMEFSFKTPPAPLTASTYPLKFGIIADIGQTLNTSNGLQNLANQNIDFLLYAGDLTYADNYMPCKLDGQNLAQWKVNNATVIYPEPGGFGPLWTCQARWDFFLGVPGTQNVFGSSLAVVSPGNHEIEGNVDSTRMSWPTPTSSFFSFASGDYEYQSFAARFPSGALSPSQFGDINANHYWSHNIGPVHVTILNTLLPYIAGTPQHTWAVADLAAVNRTQTPWLIVLHHMPIYHTYAQPYKSCECFRAVFEPIYSQYGVDFVVQGHVHSYERSHPVYNYVVTPTAPVYLQVGDGGSDEGLTRSFIDGVDSASGQPFCSDFLSYAAVAAGSRGNNIWPDNYPAKAATLANASSPKYAPSSFGPGYEKAVSLPNCNAMTFQPASVISPTGGSIEDPNGSGGFFCPNSQPAWSAFRDPSFGVATITFESATQATFAFYRTTDAVNAAGTALKPGKAPVADSVTYNRLPHSPPSPPSPKPHPPPPKKKKKGGKGL